MALAMTYPAERECQTSDLLALSTHTYSPRPVVIIRGPGMADETPHSLDCFPNCDIASFAFRSSVRVLPGSLAGNGGSGSVPASLVAWRHSSSVNTLPRPSSRWLPPRISVTACWIRKRVGSALRLSINRGSRLSTWTTSSVSRDRHSRSVAVSTLYACKSNLPVWYNRGIQSSGDVVSAPEHDTGG